MVRSGLHCYVPGSGRPRRELHTLRLRLDISLPTKNIPASIAETKLVPVPANGSTNTPPAKPAMATTRSAESGKLVGRSVFPRLVTDRAEIVPKVAQISSLASNDARVAAVVFHELLTVAADLWLQPRSRELCGLTLGVVQEGVVSWIQIVAANEAVLHCDRDPMPELELAGEAREKASMPNAAGGRGRVPRQA